MDPPSECYNDIRFELLTARIKEQIEVNKTVNDEVVELKEQSEVLDEYRNDLKYSSPISKKKEMNIANTLSSFSSIQFGGSYLTTTLKCIQATFKDEEHGDIFFPDKVRENMTFNSLSPCQGCGRMFKRYDHVHEKAYYIHCIKECSSYQNLNLITKCNECQKLFLNGSAMERHVCNRIIPMYDGKPIAIPKKATYKLNCCTFKSVPCIGCGREFKRLIDKTGAKHFEKDYYIHCISDCEEYQKLGFAQVCLGCDKWFLNTGAISMHKCNIQSKDRTSVTNRDKKVFSGKEVTKPKWMPMNIFKHSARGLTKPRKPKMCPGCKSVIQGGRISRGYSSFSYLVHCIEECSEYKKLNLIRKCKQSEFKFLNSFSYAKHLKTHRQNNV